MKTIARILCVTTLLTALAPDVMADTGTKRKPAPMTETESRALEERAAQAPQLEQFEAGSAAGVVITLLIIAALCALIYFLVVKANNRSYPSPR
jgi:hypothetical protein